VTAFDIGALASLGTMVMVWLGYPLVMGVLATWARRRTRDVAPNPTTIAQSVSIVIATRDDPAAVRARVEDLVKASGAPARLEVVVAVDARRAGDSLEELRPAFDGLRIVRGDEPGGKAATLNAGVRAASGEVIVFTDTSQRFHPEAVNALVTALAKPGVGAVSGSLELRPSGDGASSTELYWRWERWLRHCEAEVHSSVGVTGAIYAIWRSLWKPLPTGLLLDDLYTPMQIVLRGYRVGFVAGARAWETRQPRPSEEYRRKTRTLTGVLQLCVWLPALINPFRNDIWAQFLFHKLLRFLTPYCALVIGAWCVARTWPMVTSSGAFMWAGAAAVGLSLVMLGSHRTKRLGDAVLQMCVLQAAVLAATVNGLRGRWDVWHK
jgi:cellulose synthase/poly-beta-1,6-N-acetylglucosamine synthase-like glycosyltransferase